MKTSKLRRILALALVVCLCMTLVTPVSAASRRSNVGSVASRWPGVDLNSLFQRIFGGSTGDTGDSGNSGDPVKLTLVEDETTVSDGTALRASTYSAEDGTNVKRWPVTLFNYNQDTINAATHQKEIDAALASDAGIAGLKTWKGIYFSPGFINEESCYTVAEYTPTVDDNNSVQIEDGTYLLYSSENLCYLTGGINSNSDWGTTVLLGTRTQSDAGVLTIKKNQEAGNYTIQNSSGEYLAITASNAAEYQTEEHTVQIISNNNNILIQDGGLYLNALWGTNKTYFGGYTAGSSITFYSVSGVKDALPYATWNYWTGFVTDDSSVSTTTVQPDQTGNKGYVYTGMVKNKLNNGEIEFNVPEAGIFDSKDKTTKDVYTNVGLPFVYDETTEYYTFDASEFGAYFEGDPADGIDLAYNKTPQHNTGGGVYLASANDGFYPFNSSTSFGANAADYHFGMIFTINFNMTSDGTLSGEDIKFEFSGDDDVWVFVDDTLVLDIGGIHDSADGTINFAQNTTSVGPTSTSQTAGKFVVDGEASTGSISGQLFNDENGTGILNQTLQTFAAKTDHTLTVYYLERGMGASNNKIKFNLPTRDSVSVRKTVSDKDSRGEALDASTMEAINQRDFYFKLYKNDTPVANTPYNIYNATNQYLFTAPTAADGTFTLKNGQTAKFVGEFATDGSTYYVEEIKDGTGWEVPSYTCKVEAASSDDPVEATKDGYSQSVTVRGTIEASESVKFVCANTLTHVNETSIEANNDTIVIDYGLPVVIDVLANDVAIKGDKSITSVSYVNTDSDSQYGTATITTDGKIVYQLTKPLTGVEVLAYTAKATASNGDVAEATAQVYIIPATSMYYEENFVGLVNFSNGWELEGTPETEPQEPGKVRDSSDSPYGSDVAYLNDSRDSNGSSMHVSTSEQYATFSYTFTGTGTSFFARTSNTSGYMRVQITGDETYTCYRDTSYKTDDDSTILYNIPVFTWEAKQYGTYTVTVTIANARGANAVGAGTDFWLDGIRVMKPLNPDDTNVTIAQNAYSDDGEANMTVVTLRQKLLGEYTILDENNDLVWDGVNFVVFTDTEGKVTTASEYKSNGPKEEVYLTDGQSVSFSLKNWDPDTNRLYLGVKAPFGSGSVQINAQTLELGNTVDCYYEIGSYATITTDSEGNTIATFKITSTSSLVSVTNIKVTGNAEFTIISGEDKTFDGSEGDDTEGGNTEGGNTDISVG